MDATGAHQDRVTPAPPPMGGGGPFREGAPGAACEAAGGAGAGDPVHVAARALRDREPPRAAQPLQGAPRPQPPPRH